MNESEYVREVQSFAFKIAMLCKSLSLLYVIQLPLARYQTPPLPKYLELTVYLIVVTMGIRLYAHCHISYISQRVAHACRIHSDLMSPINHIVPTVAELLECRREERAHQAQGWGRTAGLGGG